MTQLARSLPTAMPACDAGTLMRPRLPAIGPGVPRAARAARWLAVALTLVAAFPAEGQDKPAATGRPRPKRMTTPGASTGPSAGPRSGNAPSEATPAPPAGPAPDAAPPAPEPAGFDLPLPPLEPPAPPAPVPVLDRSLVLAAQAGLVFPFATLGPGVKTALLLEYALSRDVPIRARLSVGYEQHGGEASRLFPGPAGGADPAALENQRLVPVEVGATLDVWKHGENAYSLGAAYGLVGVWTRTHALGAWTDEAGLGHQVTFEGGYARALGDAELLVRAHWSVRKTAVAPRTQAVELPWYQTAGVLVGIGLPL